MKTKFNFKYYTIIWTVLVVLFNIIVFVTPNEFGRLSKFDATFWVAYVFIMLAFVGQLAVTWYATKGDNAAKLFYNIPLLSISLVSLLVMVIVGSLCMTIPYLPSWLAIIVCAIALGFSIISLIRALSASSAVNEIDGKIKVQTLFIKSLTVDIESLLARCKTAECKAEVQKVYEAVRYSDPMSHEALQDLEAQITLRMPELTESVEASDFEKVAKNTKEINILLNDRNKKCKLLK